MLLWMVCLKFLRDKSSANDKTEFISIKKSISEGFEKYEEALVKREIESLSSTAVLTRLNDLSDQFQT